MSRLGQNMSALEAERVRLLDRHKVVAEIIKQLDRTNIKILSAMWKYGPRNLLEVSRRTGIPFTSVYHRVAKLEKKSDRIAVLIPQLSKLGLMRIIVLVNAKPGSEDEITAALKLPNLWQSVNRCEGPFTHVSIQLVPVRFIKNFRKYVKRLSELDLVSGSKLIFTGPYIPNFPTFKYYKPSFNEWTFEWPRWLIALRKKPTEKLVDPESYVTLTDKKDILIVKELEKNARRSFADMAPVFGISLQGVKYHYDKKLVPLGIVKYFAFEVRPYPEEVAAYHEVLLKFINNLSMNRFFSLIGELFFVMGVAKVLRQNSLVVRTYTLQNQIPSLFVFLSQMAKQGTVESYSALRQDFTGRETQSISYELFDEEKGWTFDLKKCLSELSKLTRVATVRQKV